MNKLFLAATPLALASTLFLSACGGGDDASSGAGTPAKFASTDDVAVLVGGFGDLLLTLEGSFGSTAVKSKRGVASKSLMAKATTTENCDSGSISFTDDASTTFLDDGLTVASSCRSSFSDSSSSFNSTVNGRVTDRCTDGAQTSSVCNASNTRIADGANGNSTFDLAFAGSDSGEPFDFEIRIKADASDSSSNGTDLSQLSGTIQFNDRVERLSGAALFDNMRTTDTFNSSTGGGSQTIDGGFGFTSSVSKCAIGKATIRTDSTLIYDSSDTFIGGQLTLTDGSGATARVNFNSDGSYTVTLANGQTRTYAEDSFDDLC